MRRSRAEPPRSRLHPGRMAAALLTAALGLGACAELDPGPAESPRPQVSPSEPADAPIPLPRPGIEVSAESHALTDRYARTENRLLSRGLLRTDDGADTQFDATALTASFMQVAMYDEYAPASGTLVARQTARPLRRWQDPVRVRVVFGPSVPEQVRGPDRASLRRLVDRLARTTGHDIALTDGAGNMQVYILNEDERRALAPQLVVMVPGMTETVASTLRDLAPTELCAVVGIYDDASPSVLRRALVFVRAEHPPLLRRSCFHEELAQGLGLGNDSPVARPSVFNDDEEFALLTAMDDLMLRILYDPRLQPGMTSAEALPIVETIAAELMGPPDSAALSPAPDQGEG